jgi:hypothetical protein
MTAEGRHAMPIKPTAKPQAIIRIVFSVAFCGFAIEATAADLPVGQRYRASVSGDKAQSAIRLAEPAKTATVGARSAALPGGTQMTVVAGQAMAVRTRFIEVRSVMERAIKPGDAATKGDIELLRARMKDLQSELDVLEAVQPADFAELSGKILAQTREWFRSGMTIISPPAEGVVDLPLPSIVAKQAKTIADAIDQLVAKASGDAPAQRTVKLPPKPAPAAAMPASNGKAPVPPASLQPMRSSSLARPR